MKSGLEARIDHLTEATRSYMAAQDPTSILGSDGKIARRLPAYEHRSEQLEMARAVTEAIQQPGHLVVEAGTGVGKSFAYLVPAILAAVHDKKKVVISTHTIALQEQLLNKDIPFLQSVMEEEFTAVLVKGRSNYISLRRLNVAVQRQDSIFQRVEESDQLGTVRMWSGRHVGWKPLGPELSTIPYRMGSRAK